MAGDADGGDGSSGHRGQFPELRIRMARGGVRLGGDPTATLPDPAGAVQDAFGSSLAISGASIFVGDADADSEDGSAYEYSATGSVWPTTPSVTLSDPNARRGDFFGGALAVSDSTAIVSAIGALGFGLAYLYGT